MKTPETETTTDSPNIPKCQKHLLKSLQEPEGRIIPPPLAFRLRRGITDRLNPRQKRMVKKQLNRLFSSSGGGWPLPSGNEASSDAFEPGDRVRVRSLEEIEKTLDIFGQRKGCALMEEMKPYCGTTQRVLKPVTRFVDERSQALKKGRGMVLLENAICEGTRRFGPCDRSCFYFWRVEWLEKI